MSDAASTGPGLLARFDDPAWRTAAGTVASYLLILALLFVLLFVVPLVVFVALGLP